MATRKDIKAILPEIEDDAMAKLLTLIHSETDALKDERDDLKKQIATLNADVESAKTAKEKAEAELTEFKNQKTATETRASKESAYKKLLTDSGVGEKHLKLIMKATDLDALELNKDGSLKGADKLTESIKADYADYITVQQQHGANVPNPPAGGKTGKYSSKEEIMKIKDTAERQAAIAENHELFGI